MLLKIEIPSPLGPLLAVADDAALLLLDFVEPERASTSLARLLRLTQRVDAPLGVNLGGHAILDQTAVELAEYFAGKRQVFSIPLAPCGTAFELRAWEQLRVIPFGQTWSYGQQALAMKSPRAVRAVGGANGRNVLAVVIPCHRVIGSAGDLTGYGGGIDRKRWLLDHERRAMGEAAPTLSAALVDPQMAAARSRRETVGATRQHLMFQSTAGAGRSADRLNRWW